MNILLTVPNYFLHSFGGVQTYVHCLAKELLCRGHQIIVLTAMPRQNEDEPFAIKKYPYKNIKVIAYSINPNCTDAKERHTGSGPLKRQVLRDILTECGPDLVHINDMDPTITSLCNEMRIPHAVTAHSAAIACPSAALLKTDSVVCEKPMNPQDCITCYLRPYPWYAGGLIGKMPGFLYRWYGGTLGRRRNLSYLARGLLCPWLIEQDILEKRRVLDLAQFVMAPSLFVRNLLLRNGCDFQKILMIPHGIDIIEKSPIKDLGKRPVSFGYIGRISPKKGLHILLESAGLLPGDSACEIHIFGASTYAADEKYLEQILSGYKGGAAIFTHGLIPHDKLYEAFAIVDVLVVPSFIPEAFGLVVQEAFSAGRPVIVAKSGALAERVRDGIDGFVVERNNPRSLSRAMQKIITNPGLIREMAETLPNVKTGAEYADEMEALYRRVIDEVGTISMKMPADGIGTGLGRDREDHWAEIARQWQQAGPPLRPSAQDLGFCIDAVRGWHRYRGVAPRVLLLGVTPDLYLLPWPEGTDVLAIDRSQPMIDIVWPGPKKAVLFTDWLALALPGSSRDIALCDGGLHLLSYPQEQRQLVRILHGLLPDKGLCILRLFVPPQQRESPDAVLQDLIEGRISNINILKLRLAMSLQDSAAKGVELKKVWSTFHEIASDLEGLAEKIGWPIEHMLTMDIYRDSKARYSFVTVDQAYDLFCGNSGGFKLRYLHVPSYELGERCPTIVLQRRSDTSDLEPLRTEH